MDDTLKRSAEDGDVEALYSILALDPYSLERIDQVPIVDTPLHIAASLGHTNYAMEIASLKPTLAWKLNHLGLSPMHLALQNGHHQLVTAMITIDSEFVRVKAKGRITPVHYLAKTENIDLLAEFLSACPSSIEDLTVQCETAVHVAVKNKRYGAFKVLLGWLRRVNKEEILKWKDGDGNTVFHIATSTNQPEVMKSLIKYVNVNAENMRGLTAMDVFRLQGYSLNREVGKILRRAKAKRASKLAGSTVTLAHYFSRDLSLIERRDKYLGIFGQSQNQSLGDVRSVVLVVAILIATATYQAGLSPPGGYWQDNSDPPSNNTTSSGVHQAGQMIMGPSFLLYFFSLNTTAFYASIGIILILMTGLPYSKILYVSISFLLYAYYASVTSTFPSQGNMYRWPNLVFTVLTYVFAVIVHLIPSVSSSRHEKLKRRVDNLKRRLGGPI
ncbi:hypothetical protein ACOSP7_025418 [Xanthoceras sorbifolium]